MRADGLALPHSGVARLVRDVLEIEDGRIVCRGELPLGSPLVGEEGAPAFIAFEFGAQAAALLGAASCDAGAPRSGYVVGIREARFARRMIDVGEPLIAEARLLGSAPPLAVYAIRVTLDGEEIATASLSVYVPS